MKVRNILLSLMISLFFFGAMQARIVKVTVSNQTDVPVKMLLRKTGYGGFKYGITMVSTKIYEVDAKAKNKVCDWVFKGSGKKFRLYAVVEKVFLSYNPRIVIELPRNVYFIWKCKKRIKSGGIVVFPRDFKFIRKRYKRGSTSPFGF